MEKQLFSLKKNLNLPIENNFRETISGSRNGLIHDSPAFIYLLEGFFSSKSLTP